MPMEKNLAKQCDMELMKMAMLKHEETFRQQVHELHRLYRIQKQLMHDLSSSSELRRQRRRQKQKQPRRMLNLQLPADEYIVRTEEDAMPAGEHDHAELELTLAIGGGTRKKRESTPFASDSGASLSSSSTESGGVPTTGHEWGVVLQVPADVPYHRAMPFDLGEGQPPWLVQCLSLRMT